VPGIKAYPVPAFLLVPGIKAYPILAFPSAFCIHGIEETHF